MLMLQMLMLRSHGVGWGGDVNVPSTALLRRAQNVDATLRVPSALHMMLMLQILMLRSHGVGWGDLGVRVSHHVPHCMLLLLLMMMIPSNSSRRGAFFVGVARKHTVVTCHSVL